MTRKYFLDWLRVIAFGVLIFFHVGMLYVTWGYNLKSPRIYPALEWGMEVALPWRMALLFVISGVACRFLIAKLGAGRFALDRLTRLGVVILTGMLLVNPIQVWVQLISQGDTTKGYLDFWFTSYLASDSSLYQSLGRPMPTWDHLWFLVYLLFYTLLFAAVFALSRMRKSETRLPFWTVLILPALWMSVTNVVIATWAPFTHALVNDWGAHLKWLGLFAIGAVLAYRTENWTVIRQHRHTLLCSALCLLAILFASRYAVMHTDEKDLYGMAYRVVQGIYGWVVVLTLAGYAAHHLDKPSSTLSYLNEAVLPVYVVHQPILLAAAYLLFPLSLPVAIEASLLVCATALGSLAIYHVAIRPWRAARFLFGLKREQPIQDVAKIPSVAKPK
jgi:glucan biosynthesis protein C